LRRHPRGGLIDKQPTPTKKRPPPPPPEKQPPPLENQTEDSRGKVLVIEGRLRSQKKKLVLFTKVKPPGGICKEGKEKIPKRGRGKGTRLGNVEGQKSLEKGIKGEEGAI